MMMESLGTDSRILMSLPLVAQGCGFLVICLTLILLSGVFPILITPFTVILDLVLGICFFTIQRWKDERWSHTLIVVLAGAVFLISLLFIVSYFLEGPQGGVVVLNGEGTGATDLAIRSFVTVIGLSLIAFVLLTFRFPHTLMRDIDAVLSAIVFFIGVFTLVGYAYQSPYLYGGSIHPVTVLSAVLFVIMGTGLLAYLGTSSRLLTVFLDNSVRALMMRSFIPPIIAAVLIEGWICLVVLAGPNIVNPALLSAAVILLSVAGVAIIVVVLANQISLVIIRAELKKELAEVQKEKSLTLFKTMFDSAGDAIWLTNRNFILDTNRAAEVMFGRPRDQINGRSPFAFSPKLQTDGQLSADKAKEKMDAAFKGEPQFFEWLYTRSDGIPFYAEVTLNRVKCADEYYLQASVRDITLRKEAEENLQRVYKQIAASEKEIRQKYEGSGIVLT